MAHIERFAPSPTGLLHLGHAYSAITAWESAQSAGGGFLLRIEDIDQTRARAEFEQAIFDDLHWLGLSWPAPILRQSDNMPAYRTALGILQGHGLTYACDCTRSDIKTAIKNPVYGPDGLVYPGTCRDQGHKHRDNIAIRLNMGKAIKYLGEQIVNELHFMDAGKQHMLDAGTLMDRCGDVILARRDSGTSYHLSVVIDDAAQTITHVTRGKDLFEATQIHRILQALLNLPTPQYHHHRLILDDNGKRLAKSDNARAIRKYREDGATVNDIRMMVGLSNR